MNNRIMEEIWKDIEGYDGMYIVSNLGRVKSLRFNKEKLMSQCLAGVGYPSLNLSKNNNSKLMYVHQLVAMAFLNHERKSYKGLIVDHIDNDKLNNSVDNLQLVTARINSSKDKKNKSSKYTGVCWDKQMQKWRSNIKIDNKAKFLGLFNCELAASLAYQNSLNGL